MNNVNVKIEFNEKVKKEGLCGNNKEYGGCFGKGKRIEVGQYIWKLARE